ncbi:MAG: DNA polymerase III subunit delta' [Actinomycetota bacterium]
MSTVLDGVPGQDPAISFLKQAVARPHHAYVMAGPEGGGKRLAMGAFAAALLCPNGGCGECRACVLALEEKHPNVFIVEPEGRDIHVETIRQEVWHHVYRTSPEPGRKVFLIREADRLSPSAADALLKVLEEPPPDSVLLLSSARPDELPGTIVSRCHTVTFLPLAEDFVVQALVEGGADEERALLAARLTGGNLGRARRLVRDEEGLAFRDTAREALALATSGAKGAIEAAAMVVEAAAAYKKGLAGDLTRDLEPFLAPDGKPDDAFRGVAKRIEERHQRRVRRAERDFMDWVLLAVSSLLRDRVLVGVGGNPAWRLNLDMGPHPSMPLEAAARDMGAIEEARAALADETNLNAKLVLERAFLMIAAEHSV